MYRNVTVGPKLTFVGTDEVLQADAGHLEDGEGVASLSILT